jgi:hypothetical protein
MACNGQTTHKGCTDQRIAWNVLAGCHRYVSLRERGRTQGVVAEYFSRFARIDENEYAVDFALHILIGLRFEIAIQAFGAADKSSAIEMGAEWFDF